MSLSSRVFRNRHVSASDGFTVRRFSAALFALAFLYCLTCQGIDCSAAESAFAFKDVIQKAEEMAHKSYQPPPDIPKYLSNLTYEQWRSIYFRNTQSLWSSRNHFNIQFLHLGYLYKQPVKINLVDSRGVHPFSFSPKLFHYGPNEIAQKVPDHLGFAGFSLFYPLHGRKNRNEVLAFLGASYFRALGKNQWFGLSARGIAIDTASPKGEQFPYFKEFWLVVPARRAKAMKIYALLDGESVTGAYQFVVHPGDQTIMDVESVVFLRQKVEKFGIAPFSSMFLQGTTTAKIYDSLLPQVHDSDGLSIQTLNNTWIWRPLDNPGRLQVYSFELNNPIGFGLMQRDRRFCSYESLSLHYQDRPSAWVSPSGKWGKGEVQLVEIPTESDNNDNIVAFWMPDKTPEPLKPFHFAYRLSWQGDHMTLPKVGQVVNTRTGRDNSGNKVQQFVIDFANGNLDSLSPDEVSAVISVSKDAKLLTHRILSNEFVHGLRLEFSVQFTGKSVQLRAYLAKNDKAVTETWDYVYNPG